MTLCLTNLYIAFISSSQSAYISVFGAVEGNLSDKANQVRLEADFNTQEVIINFNLREGMNLWQMKI
jgi:hypothetical protein